MSFLFLEFSVFKMNTMDNYESMPMQEFDIKGGICGGGGYLQAKERKCEN